MSKQLKVNLLFQADTTAAINNMQQLGMLLNQISTKTTIGVDGGQLQQAVTSAQQLQIHLQNAVNVNTGKLDLNKLNSSLKKSGQTLQSLTSNLQAAGPTGQQAFLKVATAVASAEAPMLRVNQRLKDFGVTLANTIKWQIASTAIHGISGMLSSAVSHAEDLNKALNDIRIVTGYSTNTMANFAIEASNAAKELNTTTTEYARAALIFYQQGLSGDAVAERANTVVKLAQVTGQSMETVSSQMTAIWNNFDDGTKSLEYYADVLTKLGAATAASTDEISDGLEKFAAIADTVGLSYETAAAAVATVVDKTRQSADVVGTSFKTVFARMEGLKLGETLEDGVDLNKYSQALANVGIDILNAKGELRSMDDILFELGEKWEGFGETTQIALAQTVGGVRQYNQMISLMDNWDSVVDNIELAKNATGELAEQQQIWSESYEAAAQKVKQAQNELYEKFINDKSIVVLNDVFAELIGTISKVIDSMGGVLPLALTLVGVFSKTLFPLLQAGFQTLRNNIAVLTGSAAKEIAQMQSSMQSALGDTMTSGGMGEAQKQQIALTQKLLAMKQDMTSASKRMTLAQQQEAQAALESYEALSALVQGSLQHKAALEDEIRLMKEKMNTGSAKREMGEVAALDNFRQKNQGSDLDVDSVVDQATTSSLASTQKELDDLDAAAATKASRKLAIEKEIQSTKQSIAALEKNFDNTSDRNVKRQTEILDKVSAQEEKLRQLQAEAETLNESDEERRKHLEAVKQLQLDIVAASQQEVDKMVVGKASTTAFGDNKFSRGEDVGALEQGMTNDVVSTLGGTQDATTGDVQVGASLENLEKLYGLMAKYKTQIGEIAAMEADFSKASQKSAKALAEKTKAQDKAKSAAEKVQKAEEKYNKLLKAEKKDSAAIAKAKRELAKAQKEQKEALEDVNRATKQSESAQGDYVKTLQNSKAKILEMAKAAGASEKDLQALSDDFAKLGKEGSEQAVTNITNKLKDLKVASQDTDNSLDLLAASMRESLLGAGFNPQQLDGLIQKLQEMGLITPDIANKMRMLGTAGDEVGNKLTATQTKFMSVTQSIASAAGQITMVIGAVKTMISAFDEGNTPLETFSSLMMGVSMILPIVIGATKALAAAEWVANAAKAMGTKITAAQTAAETAQGIQRLILMAKTWLLTQAEVALKIAQNPILGAVILGLIIASTVAIGVMTSKTQDATEAQLEKNKADMEAAEQTAELTSKWAEQQDAMDGLIKKYKDLQEAGDDYAETVDEIIEAVPELIEAYHAAAEGVGIDVGEGSDFAAIEQRMKNAAAVGDVEAIEAAQNEMDALISPQAAEAAQKGYTAAVNTLATTLTETQGDIKDNKYSVDVGGADAFWGSKEEEKAWGYVSQYMGDNATEGGRNFWGNYGGTISMDMGTNDEFMTDYENLMKARDEMAANMDPEDLKNSDVYREINELLDATEEEYNKAKEMQAEAKKFGVYDAKANLEAQGMDITEIDSLEEYQKYRDALLNDENVKGDPEAEAVARQWLEANAHVEDYVKAEQKIGYVKDQAGQEAADALTAMYDTLDEDEKKLFLEVDFTKYQSSAAVRAEIERLQSEADAQEIQVKMTAASTAKDSLKESGMTEEDWIGIRDSGIEWGKEGVIQFTEFLAMSYEEQSKYLERIQADQNEALENVKKSTLANLYQDLAKLPDDTDNYQVEYEAIQNNITALEEELMILEKVNTAKELKDYEIDTDEYEDMAEIFRDLADAGAEGYEALKNNEEAVKDSTVRYLRMNEAIEDIYDNYEDYIDVLKAAKRASTPIEKANLLNEKSAKSLRKSLAGLLGTTEDLIDADLMAAINPKDFEAAANGNAKAIERIRNQFIDLQAQMYGCEGEADAFKQRLAELADGAYIDLNTDPFLNALIQAAVQAGATATEIESMLSGFGIDADVTPFTEELWQATQNAQAAGKNIADATSFTTEVETADVDASSEVELPQYQEVASAQTRVMGYNQVPLGNGFTAAVFPSVITTTQKRVDTSTVPQTIEKTETTVGQSVTTGNGTTSKGGVIVKNAHKATSASKTPSVSNTSRAPVGSSGSGGGGSTPKTKPTSESRKKKVEVVDRYKEVEDKLDDVRDAMEDASKSADRLWGASRVKQLQKVNREIQNEIALLKRQKQEAISYLSIDKTDLISKGGALGAIFEFDSSGNIANYEEAMSRVYAAREAMLDSFGAEMDEAEEERLKDFDERLEKLKDAIEQYDETRELIEDLDNTIDDQFNAWQDNNYEILNHTLEVNIEINDRELEILDYYLSKIEDDFYNMAEAGALMLGNLSGKNIGEGGQLGGYIEGLQEYEDHLERLKQSYEKGEISQAAYIEGLQEVQDGLLENLESIQELDKTMMEYYGDTIAAAGEELAKFTDQMEHQSSVLEHYKAILELTGKETDYEAIGIVLEGQAKAAENRVKVNKETADMYREQADARYAEYQKALAQGNEQAAELYKKQYEAALQAANEAEEEYLSSVEEWAESVRAVLENTMADLSRTLENALTGGTSFDQMSIALERAASLQEEYLTSTNQIYETNKLMRSAQQEIDKMTNSVAKRRLQAFISETKELQNQKELSQYELEIQQAKYDLLLAQIALEEAQQSKSTVRLQRDNEGNFGYVYTADSSQIADAQQKLEDAQNSLYNIGLEGANGYAEKYQQTLSEMYDTLTDLQNQYLEGAFESEEEYHKAVDAAKHYYYDKLTQYSNLYTIALTTDSRVAADAWSSDFQDMIYSTDEWRSAVDTYINDIQSAFQVYGYEMERIANETIGTSLDTIKDKTEEVVDASDKLVSTITDDGGVIDALTSEMNAVANLTGEYANLRSTLQGLLSDYEKLLKGINDTTEAEKDKPDAGGDKPKEPSNPSSPSKPNTPAPSTPQADGERNYDSTTKQGVALAIWNGNYGWGNGTARKQRLEEKGFNYREIQGIVDRTNTNGNWRSRYGISDLSKYAYSSFDTGGYTGNWEGQYGKLALLHQKELVLNAGDTENFLASMEILERILKVIDLQSASAQIGGLLSSPGFIGSGSQVVEQSVTIEASFPGVQDRNEIEEAFNNLINRASQYANRK